MAEIEAAIESELGWISEGRRAGPDLELQARESVRRVLANFGVHGAQISTSTSGGRMVVDIALPQLPARVEQVRLRFGSR
jgi:hypothetical protein